MKRDNVGTIRRKLKIYRGLFIATSVALLAFPVAVNGDFVKERYQILINGRSVGTAESKEAAQAAYEQARLELNAQSDALTLVDAAVAYEPVKKSFGKAEDAETLKQNVYQELQACTVDNKTLAYTLKINNYTVTLSSEAEVLQVLEQVQNNYDTDDEFMIELASENKQEVGAMSTNVVNASKTANNPPVVAADAEGNPTIADASVNVGEDGILSVEFQENIEVIETYASQDQLSDVQTAYESITKEQENNEVYQVQAGDCLSTIADKYGMTTGELLAINEGMEIDSNILVGDQIVVMVPKPELSVVMREQTTYTEDYEADVQYVDNPNKYVGDDTVIQEPQTGNRTVTAIVSYNNGAETGREIIKQAINTEAVPKIVERGTMPLPTYIRPTTYGTLTSGFGARWGTIHKGIDWGVPVGTACRASRAGRVVSAGWSGGYGYCVVIDHGDGVKTRYAHLSSIQVSAGQYVDQGEVIARTGNTGDSTGPHIHFEIIVNGTAVNPAGYL